MTTILHLFFSSVRNYCTKDNNDIVTKGDRFTQHCYSLFVYNYQTLDRDISDQTKQFVLDMGRSSHWELIIAPGQEANGDNRDAFSHLFIK